MSHCSLQRRARKWLVLCVGLTRLHVMCVAVGEDRFFTRHAREWLTLGGFMGLSVKFTAPAILQGIHGDGACACALTESPGP